MATMATLLFLAENARNVTAVGILTSPRTEVVTRELESASAVCIILLVTSVTSVNLVTMEMQKTKLVDVSIILRIKFSVAWDLL